MSRADEVTVAAVDLGGSNARTASVTFSPRSTTVRIYSRLHHRPRGQRGRQQWDWNAIIAATQAGLSQALGDRPASLAIDGWGLDYGLLGGDGTCRAPFSYRADRGRAVFDGFSEADLGALRTRSMSNLSSMTTVFQLLAERDVLGAARTVLPISSLLQFELVGSISADPSVASTTGLFDPRTEGWDDELIELLGFRRDLFPPIRSAGDRLGTFEGVPVVVAYGHDTAAAISVSHLRDDDVVAVLGTWLIVGTPATLLDVEVTGSLGVESANDGVSLLLTTQHGLWVLDQLDLSTPTETSDRSLACIDLKSDELLAPSNMSTAVRRLSSTPAATPAELRASVMASYGNVISAAVEQIASQVGFDASEVVLVGGGAAIPDAVEAVQSRTPKGFRLGPPEPALLGNAARQAVSLGHFADMAHAARHVSRYPVLVRE